MARRSEWILVDDAIVVLENIYRHIEGGMAPLEAALKGSQEVGFTVLSISVSLIAVFIPLLFMGGIIGRFFREFALTVTFTIAISVVVCLTVIPMLCSRFLKARHEQHRGGLLNFFERAFSAMQRLYERALRVVLRHQLVTLLVFIVTAVTTVVLSFCTKVSPAQDTALSGVAVSAGQLFAATSDARGGTDVVCDRTRTLSVALPSARRLQQCQAASHLSLRRGRKSLPTIFTASPRWRARVATFICRPRRT